MRRYLVIGMVWVGCLIPGGVRAEWVEIGQGLPEGAIRRVSIHPKDEKAIYVSSDRAVYKPFVSKKGWKRVLTVRGVDGEIHGLFQPSESLSEVWVASSRGLQKSVDGGKSWQVVFRPVDKKARNVFWMEAVFQKKGFYWLATSNGLIQIFEDGSSANRVDTLSADRVYSILDANGQLFAATNKGIYYSADQGNRWSLCLPAHEKEIEANKDASLEQFSIEELSLQPTFSNLVWSRSDGALFAGSPKGLYQSSSQDQKWSQSQGLSIPDKNIRFVDTYEKKVFMATGQGVYEWDSETSVMKELSSGLPTKNIFQVEYHERSGDLYAATEKGVWRFQKPIYSDEKIRNIEPIDRNHQSKPDVLPSPEVNRSMREEVKGADVNRVLQFFLHEPGIRQVQEAAIRYAEVHPDKIRQWREQASRKALFPVLSMSGDSDTNQNVDIDRGGTNDPDTFIEGPAERSRDFHIGLSWDLGDLVWNDDQTSIDTRSKLMAELRDDILNEVTHLYFERRRLQVDMILRPSGELPMRIEKEIKLQELTAGIDALTGGFFSQRLNAASSAGVAKLQGG